MAGGTCEGPSSCNEREQDDDDVDGDKKQQMRLYENLTAVAGSYFSSYQRLRSEKAFSFVSCYHLVT